MSRAGPRECLAPGTRVAPGEVLVATEIGDGAHGLLPCPSAPLVGGVLRRRGVRVRYGPVPQWGDASLGGDGATLFMTSALQGDGSATAIGAAADGVDAVAVAAARAAVDECGAAVGARRLLGATSPWCQGAERALAQARQAVAEADGPLHVLGQLAASPSEREALTAAGAVVVGAVDDVPAGGAVFVPAHGVPASVRGAAADRGLRVIDATCPLVSAMQAEAKRFADRGDHIVLIGRPGDAVTSALAGQAPGRADVVDTAASAGQVRVADPRRVSYLLQPGTPVEDTASASAALRSRFPALRGPNPDGFCYAASDRAETVRAIAAACDVVLVLGEESEPDTRRLASLARDCRAKAHVVGDASGIDPSWLASAEAIGLVEATSARSGLAAEITRALSGIGPLSLVQRHVATQVNGRRAPDSAPGPAA